MLDLFLPAGRRADSLTTRLADLATQIALAGGYGLETLDGRRMLRRGPTVLLLLLLLLLLLRRLQLRRRRRSLATGW